MSKTYTRCKRWCSYLLLCIGALLISFSGNAQPLIEVDGNPADWENVLNNPGLVKAVSFVVDVKQPDGTDNQFTTGAKDYSAAADMGWSWSQVNDKNELTNAAVAIIEEEGPLGIGIEKHMYFFTDRFSTNGSAEVGFWVFQNGTAPVGDPDWNFAPEKTIGDLLILATFTNGGRVDNLELYQWRYPASSKEGKFEQLVSTPGVNACAYVSKPSEDQTNAFQNGDGDWYYPVPGYADWAICNKEAKDCDNYYDGAFFEGCINLSWLEQQGFLPIKLCGGTFLMETRESHKLSSAVNDFIGGSLNYEFEITATDQTVCEDPDGGLVDVNLCALTKEGGTDFLPGTTFKWYYNEDNALNDENPMFGQSFRCTGEAYLRMSYSTTLWVVGTDPDGCVSAPVPATLTIEPRPELTDGSLTVCEDVAGEGVGTFNLEDAANLAAMGLDPATMTISYGVPGGSDLNQFEGEEGDEITVTAFINGYTLDCQASAKIVLHVEPRPVLTDGSLTVCEDVAGEGVGTFDLEDAANLAAMGLDPATMTISYGVPGGSDLNQFEGEEGDEITVTAFINGYTLDCQSSAKIVLHIEPRPVLTDGSLTVCEDVAGEGVGTFDLEDAANLAAMGLDPATMTISYGVPGGSDLNQFEGEEGDEIIVTAFINGYTLDCQSSAKIVLHIVPRPILQSTSISICEEEQGTSRARFNIDPAVIVAKLLEMGIDGSNVVFDRFEFGGVPIDPTAYGDYEVVSSRTINVFAHATGYDLNCQTFASVTLNVLPRPVVNPIPDAECLEINGGPDHVTVCATAVDGYLVEWFDNALLLGDPVFSEILDGTDQSCYDAYVSTTTSFWVRSTNLATNCASDPEEVVANRFDEIECEIDEDASNGSIDDKLPYHSATGHIEVNMVQAGTGALTYVWTRESDPTDIGTNTNVLDGLRGSVTGVTFHVKITDAEGCYTECQYTLYEEPAAPECELLAKDNPCNGDELGEVWVSSTADLFGQLHYVWSYFAEDPGDTPAGGESVGTDTDHLYNLKAGWYCALIWGEDPGQDIFSECCVEVKQPPLLECEITNPTNTDCDASNGTAWLDVLDQPDPDDAALLVPGGTPPYTVKYLGKEISGLYPANLPLELTDLPKGITVATVIDAEQCETTCQIDIEENPCDVCETAYGYGGDDVSYSFLDECDEGGIWDNWGWSIHIANPVEGTYEFPMYAGSPVCDPSPGWDSHIVDTALVHYAGGIITVELPEKVDDYTWKENHIWVSELGPTDMFPDKIAPGQWLYKEGDEIPFTGGYIIVHGVYCGPKLPYISKSAEIQNPTFEESALKVYPNPFTDKVTFEFVSGKDAYGVLEIFNITGQKVARILDRPVEAGVMNRIDYEPVNKVSGIYIYRLQLDGNIQVGRVIYKE